MHDNPDIGDGNRAGMQAGGIYIDESGHTGDLLKPEIEEIWINVLARIAHGEMPPRSEPRPEARSLEQAVAALDAWRKKYEHEDKAPG